MEEQSWFVNDNSFDAFIRNTLGSNDDQHNKTVIEDYERVPSLGADLKHSSNDGVFPVNSQSVHIPVKSHQAPSQ